MAFNICEKLSRKLDSQCFLSVTQLMWPPRLENVLEPNSITRIIFTESRRFFSIREDFEDFLARDLKIPLRPSELVLDAGNGGPGFVFTNAAIDFSIRAS
jgi:hypothetical protein